jgi:thioredoxin-dependent peroxiredoxin
MKLNRLSVFLLCATSFLSVSPAFSATPVFTVESPADGKTFALADAKGKYVALHFLLKTECPFLQQRRCFF